MLKQFLGAVAAALQANPGKQALALVLVDLDHFIYINDSLGHATGDETLRKVQEALARLAAKSGAEVQRVGSDEFLFFTLVDDCSFHRSFGQSVLETVRGLALPLVSPDYDRQNANLPSALTCTTTAISFPATRLERTGTPESCLQTNASVLECLVQLCYSLMDAAKLSGRAKLVEVNLCNPCA